LIYNGQSKILIDPF